MIGQLGTNESLFEHYLAVQMNPPSWVLFSFFFFFFGRGDIHTFLQLERRDKRSVFFFMVMGHVQIREVQVLSTSHSGESSSIMHTLTWVFFFGLAGLKRKAIPSHIDNIEANHLDIDWLYIWPPHCSPDPPDFDVFV